VNQRPEKHGVFYPRGYVIITFDSAENADTVRRRLIDGGYDEEDVEVMDTEQVKQGTSDDLRQLSPVIKALGSEGDLIRGHQALAAEGDAFLLAYAPSDLDARRLMNVARKVGYHTAHKYDRFTITSL
jgi:hypothetical protein